MKRPICFATIGSIIGIIMGLCTKNIGIVLFLLCTFIIIIKILFRKKKCKNIVVRYDKRENTKEILNKINTVLTIGGVLMLFMLIFYIYTRTQEKSHKEKYAPFYGNEVKITGIIISEAQEKEYKDVYNVKVKKINGKNIKSTKLLMNVKKEEKINLKYGQEIEFVSTVEKPQQARNYKGFDYRQYLKTKGIYGIVQCKSQDIKIKKEIAIGKVENAIHIMQKKIKGNLEKLLKEVSQDKSEAKSEDVNKKLKDTEKSQNEIFALSVGLLLGDKSDISEELQEDFRDSNLSHMLAVSRSTRFLCYYGNFLFY